MTEFSDRLVAMYRWMILSRYLETACSRSNPRWFPVDGEEAAIVGTFFSARPDDVIAPHYRGPFIAYLMRGAELDRLVGQALGKSNGYSKGRAVPFSGPVAQNIVPWVAGDLGTSLSVATGAALNVRYRQEAGLADDRVVIVSFGDGTANRGDFHEAVNLAAVWKLPIVYVCQNNQYAISLSRPTYFAGSSVAARAAGYGLPGAVVDGNDPIAVDEAVRGAIDRARRGEGPSLVEAVTFRLGGHWAEDQAGYRDASEVEHRRAEDPLLRARERLRQARVESAELDAIEADARVQVEAAFERVGRFPEAGAAELGLDQVYA